MEWLITLPQNSLIDNLLSSHDESVEELCNNSKLVPELTSELDSTIIYYRGVVLQNLSFEFYKNEGDETYKTRYPFYLSLPVCLTQYSYNYNFKNHNHKFKSLNTPIPHCIAMFYEDPSIKNPVLINDTVHIAGVCEWDNTHLPVIHVFAYKVTSYNIMPPLYSLKSDYQSLVKFVTSGLGDSLLAEYVILLLGMSQNSDNRPLSLLINRNNSFCDDFLIKTLQYLVEYIKYIDSYNEPMHSKMDYDQSPEVLVPGQLQLGNGAALILNLDNLPRESMDSVENLLNGMVNYQFGPSLYQIKTKLRTILTTNKDDLTELPSASLYIKYKSDEDISLDNQIPSDYKYVQIIERAWSSPFQVDIPNSIEQLMIDSWTKKRDVASIEDFNIWVSLSRTLCYLNGENSVSEDHWSHIMELESRRRERIQ